MRRRLSAAALCLVMSGCTAQQVAAPPTVDEVLFTGTLQELAPHHSGDHFVYRATGVDGGDRLQVEHLSALDTAGEFLVNMSEDGIAIGGTHVRDDGAAVSVVSEAAPQQDAMLVYAEPLPSFVVPLPSRLPRATSSVTLLRVSDGTVLARGRAEQTMTARRVSPDASGATFELHTERSVVLPNQVMHLSATTWIAPGIGEVRSEGRTNGGPLLRRTLLCAVIGGQRVGDCAALTNAAKE